ncbi:transposase [Rhizobium beringeri]
MDCDALRDGQWERFKDCVPGGTKGKRGPRTNNRLFLDALLWMARSGGRWRTCPNGSAGTVNLTLRRQDLGVRLWFIRRGARFGAMLAWQLLAILDGGWMEYRGGER